MLDQTTSFETCGDAAPNDAFARDGASDRRAEDGMAADNVVALSRMLADIDQLWQQIERDRERLEGALPADHLARQRTTYVVLGRTRCASPGEVREQAARLRIDPAPLVASWEERERQRVAARQRAGLDRLDLADRMARSGYAEIRNQIAQTSAISVQGIAAKLELVVAGLRDGPCGDERLIAESALRDLIAPAG